MLTNYWSIINLFFLDESQFIKRPLNAYMIWTQEERKKILAQDPTLKMNDVSRMVNIKFLTI